MEYESNVKHIDMQDF